MAGMSVVAPLTRTYLFIACLYLFAVVFAFPASSPSYLASNTSFIRLLRLSAPLSSIYPELSIPTIIKYHHQSAFPKSLSSYRQLYLPSIHSQFPPSFRDHFSQLRRVGRCHPTAYESTILKNNRLHVSELSRSSSGIPFYE